jgi:hypothetical protein
MNCPVLRGHTVAGALEVAAKAKKKPEQGRARGCGIEKRQEGNLTPANVGEHEECSYEGASARERWQGKHQQRVLKEAVKVEGDDEEARDDEEGEDRRHADVPDRFRCESSIAGCALAQREGGHHTKCGTDP